MSEDEETRRQIGELQHDDRPLLVVDVDEVVLEFVTPFGNYLASQDLDLGLDKFALHGNIFARGTREAIADERVTALIDEFWDVQADWQQLALGAPEALAALSNDAQVVLLTAMPHRAREHRRKHLESLGLPYALLTTERAKGPAVAQIRNGSRPVAFVDDIVRNHLSVRDTVPDAALFQLMAHGGLRALMGEIPAGITAVADWEEAQPLIAQSLGIAA
ncbi:hypothetical protein NGM99_19525 [Mesorhizobium sp. RP14(2022)]|uniref:HAD family hydrolase n=1 Tax=Mesorhizobium liriopis TaxID=2953882 RepID=A0ABT1CBX7_9HYPH|nr:hypothetical protein [Mesorhizobium liriopis]MCO6051983.1 hypothetical protein [Mesorhizobium liriopis]